MTCSEYFKPCHCRGHREHESCPECLGSGIQPANKWDTRFMDLLGLIADWSKDPSTKTAAAIVRPDRTLVGIGYNGFPRGMSDESQLYADRTTKYDRVIHCEMNALLTCRDPLPLEGCTLYTLGPPCSRCAVHMIQAGIRRFVFTKPTEEQAERWGTARALSYFAEVDAEVVQLELV